MFRCDILSTSTPYFSLQERLICIPYKFEYIHKLNMVVFVP